MVLVKENKFRFFRVDWLWFTHVYQQTQVLSLIEREWLMAREAHKKTM